MATMKTLTQWEDLPEFSDEAEEVAFWSKHQIGPQSFFILYYTMVVINK